jgi:hypothetical protein
MKKILFLIIAVSIMFIVSACGTGGSFQANHVTNVELSEPNFNIIAKNVSGTAMQGYILGLSISQGSEIGSFGVVKVAGVDKPYDAAMKNLWENFEEEYGTVEGKKLALVNIRHDNELLNTFLYTQAKYFITADVVEFVDMD